MKKKKKYNFFQNIYISLKKKENSAQ